MNMIRVPIPLRLFGGRRPNRHRHYSQQFVDMEYPKQYPDLPDLRFPWNRRWPYDWPYHYPYPYHYPSPYPYPLPNQYVRVNPIVKDIQM